MQATRDFEVSWPIANAAFTAAAKAALPAVTPTVEHLGIAVHGTTRPARLGTLG
ncbi:MULTISPECIES: hypothetical protein [unclassified Streptomyces]|uniref:hypothetical protein n=1 Tax=unclassified Streptomyces TaxID=2593676 RepID=UPI003D91C080